MIEEDAGETLTRCVEAGLTPEHFLAPENAILFRALLDMQARRIEIGLMTVAEELKNSNRLEAVGGYSRLASITGAVQTTIQAGYLIEKVSDLASRRRLLTLSRATAEACARGDKSTSELLEALGEFHEAATILSGPLARRLEAARLHADKEPPPLRIVFKIGKAAVGTPGNLVNIKGQSKAGKSAFVGGMMGAIMRGDNEGDCLGVTSENPNGWAVIHFDTEQSKRDHFDNFKTALKRAGLTKEPDWFRSYAFTQWPIKNRILALKHALKRAKRDCGGIHSVFLDGVADFVADPNEGKECFGFVDGLQALAVEFDCVIVTVLHINPGSEDKGRGHLGSHLERRAETNLKLEYNPDSGRTVAWAEKNRRAPIPKPDGPCFRWDDASQMHVSVETMRSEKEAAERENLTETAHECYADCPSRRMKYTALVERVKTVLKCVNSTGAEKVRKMRKLSIIKDVPPSLLELVA